MLNIGVWPWCNEDLQLGQGLELGLRANMVRLKVRA